MVDREGPRVAAKRFGADGARQRRALAYRCVELPDAREVLLDRHTHARVEIPAELRTAHARQMVTGIIAMRSWSSRGARRASTRFRRRRVRRRRRGDGHTAVLVYMGPRTLWQRTRANDREEPPAALQDLRSVDRFPQLKPHDLRHGVTMEVEQHHDLAGARTSRPRAANLSQGNRLAALAASGARQQASVLGVHHDQDPTRP
jgi:hypothetical protein